MSGAFAEAVRHSGAPPPGWLWLHLAGMVEEPARPARLLGDDRDELATRKHALERRLEELAPHEPRPRDELMSLAQELSVVTGAEMWRVAGTKAAPASIRLDEEDDHASPEEILLHADRAELFARIARHLWYHIELPLLHLHVGGTRVEPVDAYRRAMEAMLLVEEWLRSCGPNQELDDAVALWREVEAVASDDASLR